MILVDNQDINSKSYHGGRRTFSDQNPGFPYDLVFPKPPQAAVYFQDDATTRGT